MPPAIAGHHAEVHVLLATRVLPTHHVYPLTPSHVAPHGHAPHVASIWFNASMHMHVRTSQLDAYYLIWLALDVTCMDHFN